MKKILSFLAAGALALGLIGCSGDLHDDEYKVIDLSNGAIPGDFDSPATWDNTTPWSSIDAANNTYTFNFKSKSDCSGTVEFKIVTVSGNWNVDGYTEVDIPVDSADAVKIPMKTGDKMGGAGNAKITGCKASTNYTMTVVANPDTSISVKVESAGAGAVPADPVPYYFDGLYLVGNCFKIGDMTNLWSFGSANLIYGASVDKKTGIVTYKKDIVATAESGEMGINDSYWGNNQNGKGITVNANADDYTELNGTEGGNFNVSGLTVGKAYRAEIKTTPDKDVLIKIYEIATVTFKFEVTGLSEGNLAWIGGNFWGASWDNGWPIDAWNKAPGCGLSVSDNAVADENGVAAFNDKWNVSTVAKPGEKLSYNFKVIATDTDWSGDPSQQTGDLSVGIDIEEDATYKISINIEDEEITVTKL
ncbi:MAG: hypothetical protein ACI4LT_02375 [Treponema sp.]